MYAGLVPDALLEEASRRFALLGDPTRLRLLRTLQERGEIAAGDLAEVTGISRSNASQHLGLLAAAGLVASPPTSTAKTGEDQWLGVDRLPVPASAG